MKSLALLFDSNFVYFAAYFVCVAAFGQYIIIKRVSDWLDKLKRAVRRAHKKTYGYPAAGVVDVEARVVTRKSLPAARKAKPLTKDEKRLMEYLQREHELNMGMHNLTSKFHKKSTAR